jgi:GNAT superfamily N-acetyltransferase
MTNPINAIPVPTVVSVESTDVECAIAVMVLAFSADPVTRWQYPDPIQYLELFPTFVRAFGGPAFKGQTARRTSDRMGAALWIPPGAELDHAALEASLPAGREREIAAVFAQLGPFHPKEPHWYLPLIAVDPARQCRGYGAALMEDTLRRCDQEHVAAYLEATHPDNIPFYRRHGFELQGTIRAGTSPPLFPMLRPAR